MVYRPTARVLTVLELLQAHRRMTGAELARRLEVDIRTVRNYIETLVDLGIPVEAERGRYGAYRLRAGYKLPPLIFTEDEALALTLSLLVARQSGLSKSIPSFEGVLAKIERVLPSETRSRIQAVAQTVAFESGTTSEAPSGLAVMVLSSAIQEGRRVHLHYRSPRSEVTERDFDPYGVAYHRGFWYTIGYCHLREGERLFRLDRIEHIEMTTETFPPRINFLALEAVQQALASVPRVWQIEVRLEATLDEAQRQTHIPKAFFTEVAGGVLLRVEVEDLPWMARLLASLDMSFTIQRPTELCEVLRQHAHKLVSYSESEEMRY
ncbi:transcriptional regulator [Ktedonobacter sp. SOSP1-85]|uniref:helix-turn-helix transcriptional regulator n=1 Tax=Ktedonobacter sp. SOSP1-85 TaxID=2778367 RepID=UPI0019166209|nr:YafY family protein [Ktedonobacter sp. SOSP1-85]GHO80368.1 transcriptional regulator [Ktedonobacter sp. SOSP1-85]